MRSFKCPYMVWHVAIYDDAHINLTSDRKELKLSSNLLELFLINIKSHELYKKQGALCNNCALNLRQAIHKNTLSRGP